MIKKTPGDLLVGSPAGNILLRPNNKTKIPTMKIHTSTRAHGAFSAIAISCAIFTVVSLAPMAHGQTIIQDNFAAAQWSNTPVIGVQPTGADVPGTSYQQAGGASDVQPIIFQSSYGFPSGVRSGGQAAGLDISLGSFNTGSFELSCDLEAQIGGQNVAPGGEALLGFYSDAPGGGSYQNPFPNFYGLSLTSAGITPVIDGEYGTLVPISNNIFTAPQLLDFVVNADGSLGTVELNGAVVPGFSGVSFGAGETNYVAMISGPEQNNNAYFTNLTLAAASVPEPGAYGMLIGGMGLLLGYGRVRRS
jgi:hypothetical protein